MKIGIISDSHTYHDTIKIPEIETLIHCGDISSYGEIWEVNNFLKWFGNLKVKNKIFICGNHEVVVGRLGSNYVTQMVNDYNNEYDTNIIYLHESGIKIDGLNFWGSPYTPEFFDWQYMYRREEGERIWQHIPEDTDVLITHGPPAGILDTVTPFGHYDLTQAGCKALLEKVKQVKPKVHCFGHIHPQYGVRRLANPKLSETLFVNASICNERYIPVNKPIVVDTDTWEVVK